MKGILFIALFTGVSKAQYGEVAPPAPVPPPDYVPYAPAEAPNSSKAPDLQSEYEKTSEQGIQQSSQPQHTVTPYDQSPQPTANVPELPDEARGPQYEGPVQPQSTLGPPQGLTAPPQTLTSVTAQVPPSAQLGLIPGAAQPAPQQQKILQSIPASRPQPVVPQRIPVSQPIKPQPSVRTRQPPRQSPTSSAKPSLISQTVPLKSQSLPPQKPPRIQPIPVSSRLPTKSKTAPAFPLRQTSGPQLLLQTTLKPSLPRQPAAPTQKRIPAQAAPSTPRQIPQVPSGTSTRSRATPGSRTITPLPQQRQTSRRPSPARVPELIAHRRPETPLISGTTTSTRPIVAATSAITTSRTTSQATRRPAGPGLRQPARIPSGQPALRRPQPVPPIDNTLGEVPSQPARLPPHTPITAPAQPDREGARGLEGLRIPPGADTNQIAPPTESKPPERFRYTDCITDTLFVVDSTSSVRRFFEDHREYVIDAIKLLLRDGDDESRVGIIEYSSPLRRIIKLPFGSHNRSEVIDVAKELPFFAGITATGAALNLTLEALQNRRPEVPTNVVVITDGFSYDLVDGPASVLHRIPNVRTFTATVTESWRQYELETIAGDTNRIYKGKNSVRDLVTALTSCNDGPRRSSSRSRNP